jgi:hypothetical protein
MKAEAPRLGTFPAVLIIAGLAACVIGWPVLVKSDWSIGGIFGFSLLWLWIASLAMTDSAPWAYRWLWAGIAIVLSFAAPLMGVLSMGIRFQDAAVGWALIAVFSSALAIFIAKRR